MHFCILYNKKQISTILRSALVWSIKIQNHFHLFVQDSIYAVANTRISVSKNRYKGINIRPKTAIYIFQLSNNLRYRKMDEKCVSLKVKNRQILVYVNNNIYKLLYESFSNIEERLVSVQKCLGKITLFLQKRHFILFFKQENK